MIELKNISFTVNADGNNKTILENINFKADDGKFIVITGPNGSGKSTLAKIIVGIENPTGGKILFNGTDITSYSVTDRAKLGVGFAFQQPVKFKGISVLDLLRISTGKQLSISNACDYLSEVGLCARDYINREVNASLSGGELKRIEIATVIARNPSLSIFDEPEAGIDLWSFKNLITVFEKMRERNNSGTIIVISHQERILSIADEIIVLNEKTIARHGTREEILPEILGTSAAVGSCTVLEEDKK